MMMMMICYHSNSMTLILALSTDNYFENGKLNFFLLSNFGKKDKMQLWAKFKKILYIRFRATSNFQKV